MKICLRSLHLTTVVFVFGLIASAPADGPDARIITLSLDPQNVTVLHLKTGYVSSVRLPEEVRSVVLGDPGSFRAEHSESEPQLVFFKPAGPKPGQTNALITTTSGHEISLSLMSEGKADRGHSVDYVLKYERPHSFLIEEAHPRFLIEPTKEIMPTTLSTERAPTKLDPRERALPTAERTDDPHWVGKKLRIAVGRTEERGQQMRVAFSALNSSPRAIELLPPQIELAGGSGQKHHKAIKAEQVPIEDYRMTSRRLEPGGRAEGFVIFERPSFKESGERLLLEIAQAEEVDRPVLAPISFVASAVGGAK
jgi:hypothetical protein